LIERDITPKLILKIEEQPSVFSSSNKQLKRQNKGKSVFIKNG
jgi:hypothetical protein